MVDEFSDDKNVTIISGSDSSLMLTPNITLLASGNTYSLNTTIPTNTWVDLTIRGKGKQTFVSIKTADSEEQEEEEFRVRMGINGEYLHWDVIAIEAPIAKVHGWSGQERALR